MRLQDGRGTIAADHDTATRSNVTFDLIVWPVDRELSTADALAEVERFGGRPSFLGGHDKRLDAFIEAIEARYPGIRPRPGRRPV